MTNHSPNVRRALEDAQFMIEFGRIFEGTSVGVGALANAAKHLRAALAAANRENCAARSGIMRALNFTRAAIRRESIRASVAA